MNRILDPNEVEEAQKERETLPVRIDKEIFAIHPSGGHRNNSAMKVVDTLLQSHNIKGAYLIVKNALEVLATAQDIMKNDFIASMDGKKELLLGAEIGYTRRPTYDYHDDPVLAKLEESKKKISEEIKERKQLLELIKTSQVDPSTGELAEPATLLSENNTPYVKLPK